MIRSCALLAFLLAFAFNLSAQERAQKVPGEVLVRLRPFEREAHIRAEWVKALPATISLKEVKALGPKSRYSKLTLAGNGISDAEMEKLVARLPGVEATSLNYKVKFLAEPNDAQYGTQWNLEDINVEPVWEVTTGGTMANGMRIGAALSDEAIQTNHPDLSGNIWPNSPAQGSGADHGTEVASVLGAVGNNSIGIAGVNWDVDIFSSGETEDLADVIEQFEAATLVREQFNASNGASGLCVVSITASWGIPDAACNGFMAPLFTDMTAAGIILVAAGPNEPQDLDVEFDFPSNCALAEHLVVTSYGPLNEVPYATGNNSVHLLAPGVDIPVATVGGAYAVVDGNSFAIPTVAGAIALLYSVPCPAFAQLVLDDPQAAREQVKNAVLNNTAPFPGGSTLTITGGKLDVHAAYQALMTGCVPTCTEYTITLTTAGDPVTSWWITDVDNAVILTGGGNTITTCLDDGCYTINLLGANSLPMEADYSVEDANGEVAIGNSFGGIIQFGVGVQIPGCTNPNSANYDPQANCNDGSCCTGDLVQVVVLPADLETEGTVDMVVTSNGNELFNGLISIAFDPEFSLPVGTWGGCATTGCFSVQVSNATMPLGNAGYIILNNDIANPEPFSIANGYFGVIGGTTQLEICDGQDNDCDGLIDEDFLWYADADSDGWGANAAPGISCTPLAGAVQITGDCDDTNAQVNPDMPDGCDQADGIDNNCNGQAEDDASAWFTDADGDGWGDVNSFVIACTQPPATSLEPGDCDDTNNALFPGGTEICDGLDNDCDGDVDEDFLWYTDADGDGFGDDTTAQPACSPVPGAVQIGGDCDDSDPTRNSNITLLVIAADGSSEGTAHYVATSGSVVVEGDLQLTFDNDAGASVGFADLCLPNGCFTLAVQEVDVPLAQDCFLQNGPGGVQEQFLLSDTYFGTAGPLQPEVCDGLDNDCDGAVDEEFLWYVDADADGFGVNGTGLVSCTPLSGRSLVAGDCDDANITVYPGAAEVCDGLNNDCDNNTDEDFIWYTDSDGDGFGDDATQQISCTPVPGAVQVGGDCDDNNGQLHTPGQTCDDGNPNTNVDIVSNDCICMGYVSGNCPPGEVEDCNGNCAPVEWIGDGFCDDGSFDHNGVAILFNCAEFSSDGGDCQNCVAEICDGLDNDCDGQVDENFMLYVDADGDGWGDANDPGAIICEPPPTGFSSETGDCDDTNATIFPGAVEVCDGMDNNCDGFIDGYTQNFQSGCNNPMACNYDANVVCEDGSCVQGSIADGSETFATDFTATDVNGNAVNLFALLAQGKTVVLDFFTTWCAPSISMKNAGFLQDWNTHMGPDGLDLIRLVSIEIEDTATVTGSLASFLQGATWPFIATGGSAIAQQYSALGLYNDQVPTLVMICPDRSVQVIYPQPDELPYTGLFQYDQATALQLLNENCGCRGTPCTTNIGCMDVNACNYDPSATCPGPCAQAQEWFTDVDGDGYGTTSLGTACIQPANSASLAGDCNDNDGNVQVGFDLYVYSETENDFGSAHYVITQGFNVIEGDIQLPEESQGIGMLPFCIGAGCFSVQITPNDVPLWEEAFITPPGSTEDITTFNPADGFYGSLTGTSPEVCDGLDNDCDGQVDEDLPQEYADNDGDGFGDPLQPLPCDTPGVANAADCDDNDPLVGSGSCGNCTAADQLWIAQNQETIDGIVADQIINCLNTPDLEACLTSALLNGTPLGNSCVTCIAQRYSCILSTCLQACLGGFGTANCQACVEANCQQAYLGCTGLVDADDDGSYSIVDCDDNNNGVFPGALEVCDGLDNDCDGQVDENIVVTYYTDDDGDGWGNLTNTIPGDCSVPIGYTATPGDCDDTNNAIFPGAPDPCNGDGIDNDCDGINDDDGIATWYVDADADGWGDATDPGTVACGTVIGASMLGGDCDDANSSINPGIAEVPCDNIDNDCSGAVDDVDSFLWYADTDGDGFGCCNSQFACTQPQGFVALDGDCDDGDPSVFPSATELCDGIDQACDGGNERWYPDADADTFGDGASPTFACVQPPGHVANGNDCDDTDADRYPGGPIPCPECAPADLAQILSDPQYLSGLGGFCSAECLGSGLTEACLSNCIQQSSSISANCADCIAARQFCLFDECLICLLEPGSPACQACLATSACNSDFLLCSGLTDADLDGSPVPFDCNDNALTVYPGANEVCDGLDNDCDGLTDEDIVITYYTDVDGDGFGVDGTGVTGDCDQPVGTATQAGDCDDANVDINPNVAEVCDGIDNDCDGGIDNETGTLYFTDADGDGYGANASGTFSCTPIPGAVTIDGDCDDTDNSVNPGAADPCDSIDQDCSGGPLASAWYQDADGDGYGDELMVLSDCTQPMGYVNNGNDCDDADDQVFPGQGCGNCTTTEQAWLATHQVAFLNAFADCQGQCFGSNDLACLAQCMQGNGVPVGAICLSCLDAYVACGTEGPCATFCLNNPESCFGCLVLAGCFGDLANCLGQVDADNDGAWAGSDCDDSNSAISPFVTEVCDGIDNNCDGQVDEGLPQAYADNDDDGFGNPLQPVPCGTTGVANTADCDDANADIHPNAQEICDGLDNDCDGIVDDLCTGSSASSVVVRIEDEFTYFAAGAPLVAGAYVTISDPVSGVAIVTGFSDASGFFTANNIPVGTYNIGVFGPTHAPYQGTITVQPFNVLFVTVFITRIEPVDEDGDGSFTPGDCNDGNASIYPGATELCDDLDNDCDGQVDEGIFLWYIDADADGFGDPATPNPSCTPIFGYAQNNLDCDDTELTVNPITPEYCDGLDNNCNGIVDDVPDSDGDGLDDCADNCPYLPGQIGSPCELSPDPLAALGIINPTCTCAVACSEYIVVDLRTDLNSQEASFIITDDQTSAVWCQGSGFLPGINSPIVVDCCLPEGCFKLEVFDSGGDGFVSGGYQVRESGPNGRRIIDNFSNFQTGSYSSVAEPTSFCLPVGTDGTIFSSCDKLDWVNNKFIVARANPDVTAQFGVNNTTSGYEFWFFDPNGSYSYRRFRSHATSDGFGTGATRACHFKVNGWVNSPSTPHLPANMLLNVRIRGRVAGDNLPFGPACQFKIDPVRAACPLVRLQDDPSNPEDFSCGVVRQWGGPNSANNRIVANPPQPIPSVASNMVRYQFRFRIPGEGVCLVRPPQTSARIHLNWNTGSPLQCSNTYEVDVRVSLDGGATWCFGPATATQSATCADSGPWGRICNVTIQPCGAQNSAAMFVSSDDQGDMLIFPNPNDGRSMRFSFGGPVSATNGTVEFMAMNGSIVVQRGVQLEDGATSFRLDLDGDLTNGIYLARVRIGESTYVQRIVVQE